ncbi:MAG: hypothetical protein E7338_06340 [Clostridiales bacterium]|nr:hypothetical protein [Clostridiales bacterium]
MPYTLTENEKQEIITEYRDNVDRLNAYLPEGQKIALDLKGLNAKLNDEKLVRLYKRAKEVQANDAKRKSEYERLTKGSNVKADPNKMYAFDKCLFGHLKPGDTQYEKDYNNAIYNRYLENPEKFSRDTLTAEVEVNPKEFLDAVTSKDPENYLLEFYDNNTALCNDSNGVDMDVLGNNKGYLCQTTLAAGPAMMKTYKSTFGNAANYVNKINKEALFTIPDVRIDQYDALRESNLKHDKELATKFVKKAEYDAAKNDAIDKTKTFIKNAEEYDISLEGNYAFAYSCGYNRLTHEAVPLYDAVCDDLINDPAYNIDYMPLSSGQKMQISRVANDDYEDIEYKQALPKDPATREEEINRMSQKAMTEYAIANKLTAAERDMLTPQKMLDNTKPGFLRSAFTKDSKEWKNFEYMFNAFYDKNNVYYQNTTALKGEANKYLEAKGVTSLEDIENLSDRSKQKALMCYSIATKYDDLEPLNTAPKVEREQAIEDNSIIEPQAQNQQNQQVQKQKEDVMDLEGENIDDLDMSVDN